MKLVDVYDEDRLRYYGFLTLLYALLKEREPHQNISHKVMPTWDEHCSFVAGRPYERWYVVVDSGVMFGAVYLTKQREIGVHVLKSQRGHGVAKAAITELMRLHPGRHLANIAPGNEASIALFRSLGFGGPIQITLEKA